MLIHIKTNMKLTTCWIIIKVANYFSLFQCLIHIFTLCDLIWMLSLILWDILQCCSPQHCTKLAALQGLCKTSLWNATSKVTKKVVMEPWYTNKTKFWWLSCLQRPGEWKTTEKYLTWLFLVLKTQFEELPYWIVEFPNEWSCD